VPVVQLSIDHRLDMRAHHELAWARSFDADVAQALSQHDSRALIAAWPDSKHGRLARPSPDHYIPLLYAQAASDEHDAVSFPIEGFDAVSVSMRAVLFG